MSEPAPAIPIDELVRRAQGGDDGTFTALVGQFQHMAMAAALAILPDFHAAQDATQEAFLEAHRSLPALRDPGAFPGFLRAIVRHRCHRALRQADEGALPLAAMRELPAAAGADPARQLERAEATAALLAALRDLPRPQREMLALFYLHEHTQAQVAEFLGLPVTTVNNRLHAARQALQRKVLTMAGQAIQDHALPQDFPQRIGRIIQVQGPVVQAKFTASPGTNVEAGRSADAGPQPFDALFAGDDAAQPTAALHVIQRLPDGTVRAILLASDMERAMGAPAVAPGMRVIDRGPIDLTWKPGSIPRVFTRTQVHQTVDLLGHPLNEPGELLETGMKAIDLFCPLARRGNVAILGPQYTGRIALLEELAHRLADGPADLRIFNLVHPHELPAARYGLDHCAQYPGPGDVADGLQTFWMLSHAATDPGYATEPHPFHAMIYFSPLQSIQGLFPAIDPLASMSALLRPGVVGEEHCRVAAEARALLGRAKTLMADPVMLELLACLALPQARERLARFVPQRLAELNAEERLAVSRARKLERFLTTPFFVAEGFTGIAGRTVGREDVVHACAEILAGRWDDVSESALEYVGGSAEVRGR